MNLTFYIGKINCVCEEMQQDLYIIFNNITSVSILTDRYVFYLLRKLLFCMAHNYIYFSYFIFTTSFSSLLTPLFYLIM